MGCGFQKKVSSAGSYRYKGQNQRKILQRGGFEETPVIGTAGVCI
jgi:hypothetical protein